MRKIIYIDLDNTLGDYVGMAKEMEITLEDAKHTEGFFRRHKANALCNNFTQAGNRRII